MLISEYIYVEVYKIRQKILDVKIIYLTELALGRYKKDCKTTKKEAEFIDTEIQPLWTEPYSVCHYGNNILSNL